MVELYVFSGRTNPRWQLSSEDAERLRALEAHLDRSTSSPPASPGLGYRGFAYGEINALHHAYRGYVTTPETVLSDPERTIERYLLDRLPLAFEQLRRRINDDFTPPLR